MSQLLDPAHDKFIGVEVLLKAGSRIVYETLFSMRHAGRVIDLVLYEAKDYFAKSADAEVSAARARHTLELMVLGAWSNYRSQENTRCLEIEAGWDDEKIVFSVAGFVADGLGGLVPSLGKPANEASARLARYIGAIEENSTMLALRHHKDIGFIQTYAVIAADASAAHQPAQVVELSKPDNYTPAPEFAVAGNDWLAAAAPLAKEPLGSSESTEEFFGNESSDEAARAMVTGRKAAGDDGPVVINAKRALAGEESLDLKPVDDTPIEEVETVISGGDYGPDTTETVVSGSAGEPDTIETLVSGGDFGPDDTVTKVSGGDAIEPDTSTMLVKGSKVVADKTVTRIKGGAHTPKKGSLRVGGGAAAANEKAEPEQEIITSVVGVESNENDHDDVLRVSSSPDEGTPDNTVTRIKAGIKKKSEDLKRVISGKKNVSKSDQEIIKVLENSSSAEAAEVAEILMEGAQTETNDAEAAINVNGIISDLEATSKESEKATAAVEATVEKSSEEFDGQIEKAKQLMDRVELPEKVKQFLSESFKKLAQNRSELNNQIKDINGKWRVAQLEFKNKQTALTTEIAKRDEQMRRKDASIEKNKEVLARTLKSMEDYKQKAESTSDAESAHKIAQANILVSKAKENAQRLQARLDEAQKKLSQESSSRATFQLENTKLEQQLETAQRKITELEKSKAVVKEDPAMKAELDRANRQIEELKRTGKLLQEKLAAAQNPNKQSGNIGHSKGSGGKDEPTDAELKHKLDTSQKMHAKLKEDFDKTVKRLDEAKQSETKLRVEISKLQNELKAAGKAGAKKAS